MKFYQTVPVTFTVTVNFIARNHIYVHELFSKSYFISLNYVLITNMKCYFDTFVENSYLKLNLIFALITNLWKRNFELNYEYHQVTNVKYEPNEKQL